MDNVRPPYPNGTKVFQDFILCHFWSQNCVTDWKDALNKLNPKKNNRSQEIGCFLIAQKKECDPMNG